MSAIGITWSGPCDSEVASQRSDFVINYQMHFSEIRLFSFLHRASKSESAFVCLGLCPDVPTSRPSFNLLLLAPHLNSERSFFTQACRPSLPFPLFPKFSSLSRSAVPFPPCPFASLEEEAITSVDPNPPSPRAVWSRESTSDLECQGLPREAHCLHETVSPLDRMVHCLDVVNRCHQLPSVSGVDQTDRVCESERSL